MLPTLYDANDLDAVAERDEVLSKYKVLTKKDLDLKAETALLESFMAGQCHKHASWIWHFEDYLGGESQQFIENSSSYSAFNFLQLTIPSSSSQYMALCICKETMLGGGKGASHT